MQPVTASALGGGKQPTRILIVDDHEISRAALRALLRTEGIDVADVGTGDAAITVAIAFHPDVVIVDVTPADPAGFRITRQLRALPDAPAVVLTSSTSRCRFGSQLDHYPFVGKADLCVRAIENVSAPAASVPVGLRAWPPGQAGVCGSAPSASRTGRRSSVRRVS